MFKIIQLGVAVFALMASQGRVQAGIIPVGPFTGDLTETWEEFPTTFEGVGPYPSDPSFIMGGAATISNPYMTIYEPGVSDHGFLDSGDAGTSDGVKGMGIPYSHQTVTIDFTNPVASFGAYWGAGTTSFDPSIGDPAVFMIRFYDSVGTLLGSTQFPYSRPGDGVLEWHGWTSDIPIGRITYAEDGVAIDGLQATIPEPSVSTCLLLFFAVALKAGRKSRGSNS